MRYFLRAITDLPHAEERLKGASRSTQTVRAARLELVRDGGVVAAQRREVVGHRVAGDAFVMTAVEGRRQA